MVTDGYMGYMELQKVTESYTWLHMRLDMQGYTRLLMVIPGYKGVHAVTQGVT